MQDQIQQTSSGEVLNNNQLEQFKSLYYLLKGKRDTDIKLFNDYKQFKYQDIIELNSKIYRKLQLHELVTDTNSVVISLSNKEIKTFGNWREFLNFDWNIAATTKYITLEWDFNLILPNQSHNVPQTHTLRVRIGSELKPNEMIQVIFQGGGETDLEEAQSQVVCKIDFVNAQICNELKTIVTEWYDGLSPNNESNSAIKFFINYKNLIRKSITLVFLIGAVTLLNFISSYYINSVPNLQNNLLLKQFYLISSCSVIVIYFSLSFGKSYGGRIIQNRISNFRHNPIFDFTKGDSNKLQEIKTKNYKTLGKLIRDLLIAILINIIAFFIGKFYPYIAEIIH